MLVIPTFNAVTKPVDAFTVATAVLLLLQVPPVVPVLVYVAVAPIQSGDVPIIFPAVRLGLIVKVLNVAKFPQPVNV